MFILKKILIYIYDVYFRSYLEDKVVETTWAGQVKPEASWKVVSLKLSLSTRFGQNRPSV